MNSPDPKIIYEKHVDYAHALLLASKDEEARKHLRVLQALTRGGYMAYKEVCHVLGIDAIKS